METVGGDNLNQSLQALQMRGRVAVMGFLKGTGALTDIPTLLERQASILGMQAGSVADFEALNRAIEASDLHPVIDRIFPVDDGQEALRYLEAGSHFGKVGLTF